MFSISCFNFVGIINDVFKRIRYLIDVNSCTAWKVSKYGVFSGPYFLVFSPNTWKYGPEKTPYLQTFQAVLMLILPDYFFNI